jgi:hypothetical protein
MASVRELTHELRLRYRQDNLTPSEAQEIERLASSLTGNCTDEIKEAEIAYNIVLFKARREERSAKDGEIVAKTTEEYKRYRDAVDTLNELKTIISSARSYLRYKTEEMRHGL